MPSVYRIACIAMMLFLGSNPITAASAQSEQHDTLARQAQLGFRINQGDDSPVRVVHVEPNSPAYQAGLRSGHRLHRIQQQTVEFAFQAQALLKQAKGGVTLTLEFSTSDHHQTKRLQFTPEARPREQIPGVISHYRTVTISPQVQLRAIITQPEQQAGPLPALLFTQWVSCSSIEYRAGSNGLEILARLARDSGYAVIRVERSSDGDSQGPACHELDYDTELSHYEHAYRELLQDPLIAHAPIVIYGASLGSTTAPLLAQRLQQQGIDVAGVAIQGGGAYSYLERMINFDRIYLERRADAKLHDIHQQMSHRIRFHYEYLIQQRHPDAIANDNNAMAQVRSDIFGLGQGHHYGRPYAWHQQAAQHNVLAAWLSLRGQALVIFNAFEQFEMRHGHQIIARSMNQQRPGSAHYVEQSDIGHSNNRYASISDAYLWRHGESQAQQTAEVLLHWLTQTIAS